jgi:hypothetical protein
MTYGLGRLAHKDPRDHSYLMATRLTDKPARKRPWHLGPNLDQGQTPRCVGYSIRGGVLDAAPQMDKASYGLSADDIYMMSNATDEWSSLQHDGTSVRAAAKVLQLHGLIHEYLWAFDESTVRQWVLTKSPVVLGTNWYESMFTPDSEFQLHIGGPVVGGHAWFVYWYSATHDLYYMRNSWGSGWGLRGNAYLTSGDLARLLAQDGEALTVVENA